MILRRFLWAVTLLAVTVRLVGLTAALPEVVAAESSGSDERSPDRSDSTGSMTPEERTEYYELLKLFVDTLDQVERNYAEKVDRRELMEWAIEGLLSKLDDHSQYIPPDELDEFHKSVTNEFGGIGIQLGTDERRRLMVISPLVGTPAYRAGLMAGDRIVSIDGTSTRDMTVVEAVKVLKGPPGSEVTLTVIHQGRRQPTPVTIRREIVRVATVLGYRRNEDDTWHYFCDDENKIGYIRLSAFSGRTSNDLRKTLEELTRQKMRGLVLDLRFNPGGLLTSAVEVSDLFVSSGLIVTTKGRNVPSQSWSASEARTFSGFPMAVLVNRYSASASEIVAACLQDHGRAVVIGARTYGKGSVQQVVDMRDGASALKLTTGSYYRPSGKNIDRKHAENEDDWGVSPDEGYAVQLNDEALFLDRRARDIVQPKASSEDEADASDSDSPTDDDQERFVDRQLDKAIEYLKGKMAPEGPDDTP